MIKKPAYYMLKTEVKTYDKMVNALIIVLAFALPLLTLSGLTSVELINMLGRYMAFAIVAVGIDLIWGYTGILSLGQALFFAIGGYAMGMYLSFQGNLFNGIPEALYVVYPYKVGEAKGMEVLPWYWLPFKSFNLTLVLGMIIPAVIAGFVGFMGFASRVKGVYFSILTQALTVAAAMFFSKNEMKFCGTNGLTHFKTINGHDLQALDTKVGLYIATLICLILAYLASRAISKSRFGRVLVATRDSESTLRFSGYLPYLYKTAIFAFAGLLAGLGGMLYTPQANIITPSYMEPSWSILMVVWVAFGGRGSLKGAIIGTMLINLLYNTLTSQIKVGFFTWSPDYWPLLLGGLFIFIVLAFPGGLQGFIDKAKSNWTGRELYAD